MSDCSTESMKPKEPLKTCGNCGRAKTYALYCERHDAYVNADSLIYLQGHCWIPKIDTIKQRYQQLEQVARELLGVIEQIRQPIDPVLDVIVERSREALGVSLDD